MRLRPNWPSWTLLRCPSRPLLEDQDELVLAAVERAHPAIVLDPDAEVFQFAIGAVAGGQQLVEMAPVHADVVQSIRRC